MQVQVLGVRVVGKGLKIAHVKAGKFFGDVPAEEGVEPGAPGWLRIELVCRDGRLGASVRCEKKG